VQILSALFIEAMDVREEPGPTTRIDLTGIQFSAPAPNPPPLTWAPHLMVIVHCPPDENGLGALEVTYWRDGEQVARNVQPLQVDPGRFSYRLVRGEIDFDDYATIEAHCRIDLGPETIVPYTLMPPVEAG
jgi:hypothetical protein